MSASKDYEAVPDAFAFEQLAVSNSVVPLTAATYAPANQHQADQARIIGETQSVRIRFDGGNPAAGSGHLIPAGTEFVLRGASNIVRARLIRATGVDGAVSVTYSRFVK